MRSAKGRKRLRAQFVKGGGEFRADIGALRALAVASVLLFHFGVAPFNGGFAGVDVFFVISGFLMTQIIERRLVDRRFSLLAFYGARVRRIVPALAVLCIVVLALGALIMDPRTYETQARYALSSLKFLSNFEYLAEKGYFAPEARDNWFLHTWSLSVEWQFYLVYPILLLAIARASRTERWRDPILGLLALTSLAWCIVLSGRENNVSKEAFFLLPPRGWEMIAGGLVALHGAKLKLRNIVAWCMQGVGLAMIVGGMVLLDGNLQWPSYWALIPVGGTALVLLAWRPDAPWARLPAVQLLGRWSYSIYLWHWPIVVGMAYLDFPLAPLWVAGGIVLSILAGWLSFELVEIRLRDLLFAPPKWSLRLAQVGILVGAAALFTYAIIHTRGFEAQRTTPSQQILLAQYRRAEADWTSDKACAGREHSEAGLTVCRFGNSEARDVLVIGDSHGQQLEPRYAGLFLPHSGRGITFAVKPGCLILPDVERAEAGVGCRPYVEQALRLAQDGGYRRVVVIGAWQSYLDFHRTGELRPRLCFPNGVNCRAYRGRKGVAPAVDAAFVRLGEGLARARAKGTEVVLLGSFPYAADGGPRDAAKDLFKTGAPSTRYSRAEFESWTTYSGDRLRRAAARAGGTYVEPLDYLCNEADCPLIEDGLYLYKDESHFRASAVKTPMFDWLDRYLLITGDLGGS
jgi:peptidoglycan/LPS O-acetylase OafA/YrhL